MKLKIIFSAMACSTVLLHTADVFAGDTTDATDATDAKSPPPIVQTTPVSHDLFSLESTYTGSSDMRRVGLPGGNQSFGSQNSVFTDFTYGHRFHINGNWYLRLGLEYQRFDFGGSMFPLPQHLQSVSATIAYEYVVQDFAAVGVELHPGLSFENDASGKSFDMPVDIYTSFQIKKDRLFGIVGAFYGQNFDPAVDPLGGIIWLVNDKTRVEAVFPRPAIIYNLNDDWELRAGGEVGGWGFRMDTNGRTPATYSDGRLQYEYFQAGAKATYKGWKPFEVGLGAGYDFEREFDFFHYGPGQKYKSAPAPYVTVSISAKF